ncbi:MAG TPA: DUF6259 domain-containing protein [Candidatus Hydrogenedentes bacterium]|nr:DUF6259 domain-containing protein [Candidatus Hydrogenedentota bacterium]HPO85849.1 DUF6259 domain-containing protein [Candidatus Hydrogenedentota bacterium]
MQLENDHVRLILDENTGGLVSIFDKSLSYEYVAAPERALLMRVMIPTPENPSQHWDACQATIALEQNRAIVRFENTELTAEVSLRLENDALWVSARITNHSPLPIEEIILPYIRGLRPVDDASIVWPCFWYRRIENPFSPKAKGFPHGLGGDHRTWNELLQKVTARYPAHLTSAWADYGNTKQGIAIEGRHTDFSIMDFFFHKVLEKDYAPEADDPVRRTLDMAISHPRRIRTGETWESPPIRILIHRGDWHVPAEEHREWLETWVQKPERPAKFAEAIGWHFFFLKHQDGYAAHTYDELPQMADAAREAGCPYLMVFGWQEGGHDNNYFYRYVPNGAWGGEEALQRALAAVRARGVEVIPFFNGTLANIEMPEHKRFGHRWEAKTRAGHPYYAGDWARHNFDVPTRNRSMLHYEIAPCREHRAYFLETVKRIVSRYGFGNLQLDQISEKMFVDYNEDHVETTPDRVYVDGLGALLPRVREIVRMENPDGVMVSEVLNDFTGQWCDSSWDWGILFPFPEPILFTLPWLYASHEIDALEYGEANKAFAYRMHFDMKIDGGDTLITRYPKFAKHVRSLADLRKRTAPYSVYVDFRDQEGVSTDAPSHVIVKAFRNNHTRKAAVIAAETEGKSAEFHVTYQGQSVHPEIVIESNLSEPRKVNAPANVVLQLQPYEVNVLCFDLV